MQKSKQEQLDELLLIKEEDRTPQEKGMITKLTNQIESELLGEDPNAEKKAKQEKADAEKKAKQEKADAEKKAKQDAIDAEKKAIADAQGGKDNDYLPRRGERHLFHVLLGKAGFDTSTGKAKTEPYPLSKKTVFDENTGKPLPKSHLDKFTDAEWNMVSKNVHTRGLIYKIIWNPKAYKK